MALTILGGSGQPKIIWAGNTLTLPYPQKLKEEFEEIKIEHKLINGEIKKHIVGYRYLPEIVWDFLNEDSDEAGPVIEILNYLKNADNRTVKFYPHSDNDFYANVVLNSNYNLAKIGAKQKETGHSIAVKFKSNKLLNALPFGWVSPYTFSDPNTDWTNETNAYDEDDTSYATTTVSAGTFSEYLYLDFYEILANKCRFRAAQAISAKIDIDGYVDGAWVNIFYNTFSSLEEVSFTAGNVTQLRIRFENIDLVPGDCYLKEIDIGIF